MTKKKAVSAAPTSLAEATTAGRAPAALMQDNATLKEVFSGVAAAFGVTGAGPLDALVVSSDVDQTPAQPQSVISLAEHQIAVRAAFMEGAAIGADGR